LLSAMDGSHSFVVVYTNIVTETEVRDSPPMALANISLCPRLAQSGLLPSVR
jgi:hypothetical protein